ncbi:MAG: DUF3039 domain-containing protein [Rhodoglobus sp.]
MHSIRARPTVKVLAALNEGWGNVRQRRQVEAETWSELHPFAELDHPILVKSREQFGEDPARDQPRGLIDCSGELRLQEVRFSQWRAGVWTDPSTGVRWIVAIGLAKGGHEDTDDFYESLKRRLSNGAPADLLPTELDTRLLKRETAAAIYQRWQLSIQHLVAVILAEAMGTGEASGYAPHPTTPEPLVRVQVTWAAQDDCEEIVVELFDRRRPGSNLEWQIIQRVLISLAPPVQGWDIAGGIYSNLLESGHATSQSARLRQAGQTGELIFAELGNVSHYTHERHIAEASVEGSAIRALCGVFFVPLQDPVAFEPCPHCADVRDRLPGKE